MQPRSLHSMARSAPLGGPQRPRVAAFPKILMLKWFWGPHTWAQQLPLESILAAMGSLGYAWVLARGTLGGTHSGRCWRHVAGQEADLQRLQISFLTTGHNLWPRTVSCPDLQRSDLQTLGFKIRKGTGRGCGVPASQHRTPKESGRPRSRDAAAAEAYPAPDRSFRSFPAPIPHAHCASESMRCTGHCLRGLLPLMLHIPEFRGFDMMMSWGSELAGPFWDLGSGSHRTEEAPEWPKDKEAIPPCWYPPSKKEGAAENHVVLPWMKYCLRVTSQTGFEALRWNCYRSHQLRSTTRQTPAASWRSIQVFW